MGYLLLEEDLFVKHSIIDHHSPEGQRIHNFLLARAKLLARKKIDFEKNPVAFVMADAAEPNAFYAPSHKEHGTPKRNGYKNTRYTKNPLSVPVICVTKGLIDMVDNLDQLDYVLGHELTHLIIKGYGIEGNSKGEESLANLHAVDLVYDAGSDPKQALILEDKLHEYAKQHAEEAERKWRRRHSHEKETGINWSEILDVHVTHRNTRTALEASLTRLSHLIDERKPSEIDKATFAFEYSDPVTEFLKANGYENQKALGKLRILIDSIDHLSAKPSAPEEYYQAKLVALAEEEAAIDPEDWHASYKLESEKENIQKSIEIGYKGYFCGSTMEKKYQQKIAALAEGIFEQVYEERKENRRSDRHRSAINVQDLDVYLQNKAYRHIQENGYPEEGTPMFFDASGIMYTYFYALLGRYIPHGRGRHDPDEPSPRGLPQIEFDLENAKQRILGAQKLDAFVEASEYLKRLTKTYRDISSISYENNHYITKLDNLSFIDSSHDGYSRSERLYSDPEVGKPVPWNNLVGIAKANNIASDHIVTFLKEHGVEDYRITHDQLFVKKGWHTCYSVNTKGIVSKKKKQYELDYALRTDLVLRTYEHIKKYFKNESALFDKTCHDVLGLTDDDFRKTEEGGSSRSNVAHAKAIGFVQLYNSLPQDKSIEDRCPIENDSVLSFISDSFLRENPLPGSDKQGKSPLADALFEFDNPIFQKHFGEAFNKRLIEKKSVLKQKMFATALDVVKYAADMWADAYPKAKALDENRDALWEQKRVMDKDDPAKEKLEQETKALYEEMRFYQAIGETAEVIVLNYACSIIEKKSYQYALNRLTPQQKDILADCIIIDEKGIFVRLLGPQRYTAFCDFRHLLSQQIEKVICSDYTLIDTMQTAARNLGYKKAKTKEELRDFIDINYENRWHTSRYTWYLHIFDIMQHLRRSPEINLRNLAKAVGNIEVSSPNRYSDDHRKLEEEVYKNYIKLMRESRLPGLITHAIDFPNNYVGLTVAELIETADSLISLRKQMAKSLEKKTSNVRFDDKRGYYKEVKDETAPGHTALLRALDKNIRRTIRKAANQALLKEDALEKIRDLYCLYHPKDRDSSYETNRNTYLSQIVKNEHAHEKLAALSGNKSFWPEDVLDHVKAYVFAKNTFLDDIAFEDRLLNDILNKLETLPSGDKKKECIFVLLDKNLRASYPETRERLFELYSDDVLADLGMDDGSQEYQDKLSKVLAALDNDKKKDWDIGKEHGRYDTLLSNSLSAADKYLLLRRVSDKILSQEETSSLIKKACQINLKSEDLVRSYLYGVGVDYLTSEMDRTPDTAKRFLQFLNSKGETQDCEGISTYIEETISKEKSDIVIRHSRNKVLENTKPINCKVLYENFWSAPLEARAVIIARVLKCACNGQSEKSEDESKSQQSWERVFDLVMDNLVRPDDISVESRYARDVMHSYIKARSDYEREIILSAMMVANRNIGADAGNIGKALKLFLENMGPAEIKLGQAIASHPNTPESIRKELQNLKNMADIPPRWVLYEWMRAENIPEDLWKDKYLGEVLGSASYYTTVALGDSDVLRILRPEARERAAKGFRVIGDTVADLQEKDRTSDLDYRKLTASVAEMITQAARMSKTETDQTIGQRQYKYAQEIYNGVKFACGGEAFSLKVMDWKAKGQNWVIMHRAKGPIFNKLPENTPKQIAYKQSFAKAYIVFEMRQILSGLKFDHDKHGAQLCIDTKTNEVGIFDTGAMALREPTNEEQNHLGHALYDVMKSLNVKNQSVASLHRIDALGSVLSEKIEEMHKAKCDPQYLVEVKKGILALGDFFSVLNDSDIASLVFEIDIYSHISEPTKRALQEKMSLPEKAQLKFLLASRSLLNRAKSIDIQQAKLEITNHVKSYYAAPDVPYKSDWFQQVFVSPQEMDKGSAKNSSARNFTTFTADIELTSFIPPRKCPIIIIPERCVEPN